MTDKNGVGVTVIRTERWWTYVNLKVATPVILITREQDYILDKYSTCGQTVPAGIMASSVGFESGIATVAATLCILFGVIFPFASTCTGKYNAVAVESRLC